MKVSIGTKIQDGPWGGGNLFAKNLSNFLLKNDHEVRFDLKDEDLDIIILTEPRKTSPSSSFTNYDVLDYLKYKNNSAIVVHRINECDEHKDTSYINKYITYANKASDATIFVSTWIKELYINMGEVNEKPNSVILAGADYELFNNKNYKLWNKSEKIRFATHHWSDNWNKGFEVYKLFDKLLSTKKFGNLIEFNFIGRLPEGLELNNTIITQPLSGQQLADQIKKSHMYITGSLNEPSGNHHIEAGQCGLPVLYINSGGVKEYCEGYGMEYNIDNFEEILLSSINNYDELIKKASLYPRNSDKMSLEYVEFFTYLLKNKKTIIENRKKQKPTPIKDLFNKFKK